MVVKTITIKKDAYDTLKSMKRPDESFSDVILRVGQKRVTAKDLFGRMKVKNIDLDRLKKNMKANRKQWDKEWEERQHAIARRLSDD